MDEYQLDSSNVITSGELVTRLILIHSEERMHFHNQIMLFVLNLCLVSKKKRKKSPADRLLKEYQPQSFFMSGDRRVLISKF